LGRNAEAQQALTRALELEPDHPQGHWLLAGSRAATSTEHIVQLEHLARTPGTRPQARAFFNYAAGKEYEDLEQWPDAFAAFERGARAKRSIVDYDEAAEQATFDALQNTFTQQWLANAAPGHEDP